MFSAPRLENIPHPTAAWRWAGPRLGHIECTGVLRCFCKIYINLLRAFSHSPASTPFAWQGQAPLWKAAEFSPGARYKLSASSCMGLTPSQMCLAGFCSSVRPAPTTSNLLPRCNILCSMQRLLGGAENDVAARLEDLL